MTPAAVFADTRGVTTRLLPDALTFAATKIRPPILRRGLLARAALAARIAQGLLHSPLTLISAAGGFGKSSAMAQVLAAQAPGLRCAWIACEEGDTLGRLVNSLIAALEPFDLPWRVSPDALIAALDRSDGTRAFRDALVNALAATEGPRAVIVFDDLHRVADSRVDEFLAMLPERLPDHWGLALVTRVDPRWSLARLRASGQLTEIRRDELRFGVDEIEALAQQPGGAEAARALFARTEGWPVGVNLALAGGRPGSPVRNERHALDYLRSEVLDKLPPGLRAFLVRTSVLPELTAVRAAAVSGEDRADADRLIDEIERRGLYYQEVDSAERTLRLHDIFRDALDAERGRLPADERDALWRRAAETEPDAARCFDYLLAASAHDAAVDTLTRVALPLITSGMSDVVRGMLAKLPAALLTDSPQVTMLRGMMAWELMDLHGMIDHMKQAAAGFAAHGDRDGSDLARAYVALAINGLSPIGNPRSDPAYEVAVDETTPPRTRFIVSLQRAVHAFDLGDVAGASRHYGEAFDQLAREPDPALWYQGTPGVAYFGVRALEPLLERFADGALRAAGDDYPALRAMALAVRGCTAAWRGDVERARADLDEAGSLSAWINYPLTLAVYLRLGRLMCRAGQGDTATALAAFDDELPRVLETGEADGPGAAWWYLRWIELRAGLMAERHDLARQALAALRRAMPSTVASTHTGLVGIIDAYAAWLAGDLAGAEAGMGEALARYGDLDAIGIVTALHLQRAGLCLELGRAAQAAQALRQGLDGIRSHGYPLSAHFAGRGNLARLAGSTAADGLDAAQRATLDAVLQRRGVPGAAAVVVAAREPPGAPERREPVSPRELEVMALLAAGDSNKIIARRLDLSPHTVKRHVANILDKLGVESRGQAAAKYRAMRS